MIFASLHRLGRPPFAAPPFGGQWPFARAPDTDGRLDADRINQPQISQPSAELAICTVTGIGKDDTLCAASAARI